MTELDSAQNSELTEHTWSQQADSELLELRSLVTHQNERICNLERALDQSLVSLEELRFQLVEQQFLENQLAATEDIANVQQRAITQLKQQITQQKQALEAQQNQKDQTIDHQLEAELCRAHTAPQEQQALTAMLQQALTAQPIDGVSVADQELFAAHCKIQDLETQISRHHTTHVILQHTCHELEQARDRYHARTGELEQQTAEMQEQILKQAQQASEYEAAVQHWKDRCLKSQDYLRRLTTLIEKTNLNLGGELAELLITIQAMIAIPESESSIALVSRDTKMDLPDFLARRHRYRVRS